MAYKFIDADGDEAIKFERGKWDSFWGYQCPECGVYITNPTSAMNHENNLPCQYRGWNKQGKVNDGTNSRTR